MRREMMGVEDDGLAGVSAFGEGEGDGGEDVGEAKSPVKDVKEKSNGAKHKIIVKPRSTEPTADVGESAKSGGSTGEWSIKENGYHLGSRKWTVTV
jgi:hypothetical protein